MLCKKDAHNKKRAKRKSNGRDSIFRILLLVRTNKTRAKTGSIREGDKKRVSVRALSCLVFFLLAVFSPRG